VNEVQRLEFTGAKVIEVALVFVKMPNQMGMLFALPKSLRRNTLSTCFEVIFYIMYVFIVLHH
jgi:hypothetical protein